MRRGFTLIEALIALVLFEFGMLALVATNALIARDLAAFKRRASAHALASQRVELLRARACDAPAAGVADSAGFVETWTVAVQGSHSSIVDSVAFALPRGRQSSVVVRASLLCGHRI